MFPRMRCIPISAARIQTRFLVVVGNQGSLKSLESQVKSQGLRLKTPLLVRVLLRNQDLEVDLVLDPEAVDLVVVLNKPQNRAR